MLFEFFLNACILITFISIFHIFCKDKEIFNNTSLTLKIIFGLINGLLCIILLLNSVQVAHNIIIDFRYIPILLTAIYGGFLPTIVASISIGVFRVLYFGVSEPSIIALIDALVIGIGFSIITSIKSSRKNKWIFSIIYLFFVVLITFLILLKVTILFWELTATYYIGNICVSYLVFIYTEYLSESAKAYRKLKSEATIDFLTGLNNVRQFQISLSNVTQQTIRKGESLSLLYIDIDNFKEINDTYGHSSGDIILKNLADILIGTCRGFGIVSRNGGEEFSVLLLDCSESHAIRIAEGLRKNVEVNKFSISDKITINITISIGVSTYSGITDNTNNLLESADIALYEAKRTGRNKVVSYKNSNHLNQVNNN